jgi:hypothetical protein
MGMAGILARFGRIDRSQFGTVAIAPRLDVTEHNCGLSDASFRAETILRGP